MRAILIDPVKKTVTEVVYSGPYTQIYEFIHASCFTLAGSIRETSPETSPETYDHRSDDMFVDDEGLFDPKYGWFKWKGYPTPLAGYGLLLGTNHVGDSISARSTIEELGVEFGEIGKWDGKAVWLGADGSTSLIPE